LARDFWTYLNGEWVLEREARVSIFDAGFYWGDSVCEALRTFHGRLFKLPEHLDRLYQSLREARMGVGLRPPEMAQAIQDTLERNRPLFAADEEAWVSLTVTRGPISPPAREEGERSTVVIVCHPLDFRAFAHLYRTGAHVVVPPTRHLPPTSLLSSIKHRSRLHFQIARAEVQRIDPEAVPVLLDQEGYLTESDNGNFFLVREGALFTPSLRNVLPGISRAVTLELAERLGIPAYEEDIPPSAAAEAEEAFLTMTSRCLMPVTRFNGQPIGDGRPGPMFHRLMAAWSEYVGLDVLGQILTSGSQEEAV
jgi:branched-chain amino acid aminotransferase